MSHHCAVIGREAWPTGCCLKFMEGNRLSSVERVLLPCLGPENVTNVLLNVTSPAEPGVYRALWHLSTFAGTTFGGLFRYWQLRQISILSRLHAFLELMPVRPAPHGNTSGDRWSRFLQARFRKPGKVGEFYIGQGKMIIIKCLRVKVKYSLLLLTRKHFIKCLSSAVKPTIYEHVL